MTTGGLPRVLVVSVPKGGTNLLMQVVLGIPGMVQTRANMMHKGTTNVIAPGEMGVMHLPYTEQYEEFLADRNVKILFISRDPRDIAVSMMHFIANGFSSNIPTVLNFAFGQFFTTHDARISAIINGVNFQEEITDTVFANEYYVTYGSNHYPNINEFCLPFLPWKDSPSVCHVTFEELMHDSKRRTAALKRIVNFLWDDLSELGLPKGLVISGMEQNINPPMSPTFRAGRIGDWKVEFSEQHKMDFKRVAGQTLIELGYESDLSW